MKNKLKIILIIVAIILLDQIIKINIIEHFSETNLISIKNIFAITNASNTETAYALGVDSIILLIIVNIFIIYALAKILISNYKNFSEPFKVGIGLILAGEISNLLDRIFKGYIVRFIEIYKYGAFNLSDISIVIGIIVLVISFLILMIRNQEEALKK